MGRGLNTSWRLGANGVLAALVLAVPLSAQDDPMAGLDHRFMEIGSLQIEYFEFGQAGTPLIMIQDHHDYFHDYAETYQDAHLYELIDFLEELGQRHRVITPVRRGWGESDAPGYGYDVASQAEDVLGLMNRLGIGEAVLLGRTAATQEMTWIAEHHPERVAALAYWGTPIGHLPEGVVDPEVDRFAEMYNRRACDIGGGAAAEIEARLEPRRGWTAHFATDATRRIEIPALLLVHPVFDRTSMASRRLTRIEAWAPDDFGDPEAWCDEEAKAYFAALSQDSARIGALRSAFSGMDGDLTRTHDLMRRAFGQNLSIVWEDRHPENPVFGPLLEALEEFLSRLDVDM